MIHGRVKEVSKEERNRESSSKESHIVPDALIMTRTPSTTLSTRHLRGPDDS